MVKFVPALAIRQKAFHQKPVLQHPPKKEVPVGQQRCYRCGNSGHIATSCKFKDAKFNFCKLTGHLDAVCRKKAQRARKLKVANGSKSWKWTKQRRVATLRFPSFKCLFTSTGKRLPWNWTLLPVEISFLLASGQSWASRNFNRLNGVTIRQVGIHCRSLELLPPTPSTVMSATSHIQFHFLCPKFSICICLVGMLLEPCGFPWATCCFPKLLLARRITSLWLFLDLTAWIDT